MGKQAMGVYASNY